MKKNFKYIITGSTAGFVNGFFGSGGGLILVPLYISFLKLDEKKAFATSVATILPISIVSACIYFYSGSIDINVALPYIIGGAIGGFISGKVFKKISSLALHRIFGLFILYGGLKAVIGF